MKVNNATLLLTVVAQLLGNFAIEFAIASSMPLNCILDSPLKFCTPPCRLLKKEKSFPWKCPSEIHKQIVVRLGNFLRIN